MDEKSVDLLGSIANNTDSILIVFFIVLIVALIPLYAFIIHSRKHTAKIENDRLEQENKRQDRYIERESRIIDVITGNSEVIAGLRATLEKDGQTTVQSVARVHDRIDDQNKLLVLQSEVLTRVSTVLDESLRNQGIMKDDIKTSLILLNSGKYTKPCDCENTAGGTE